MWDKTINRSQVFCFCFGFFSRNVGADSYHAENTTLIAYIDIVRRSKWCVSVHAKFVYLENFFENGAPTVLRQLISIWARVQNFSPFVVSTARITAMCKKNVVRFNRKEEGKVPVFGSVNLFAFNDVLLIILSPLICYSCAHLCHVGSVYMCVSDGIRRWNSVDPGRKRKRTIVAFTRFRCQSAGQ